MLLLWRGGDFRAGWSMSFCFRNDTATLGEIMCSSEMEKLCWTTKQVET
jgi:hypothetical protein